MGKLTLTVSAIASLGIALPCQAGEKPYHNAQEYVGSDSNCGGLYGAEASPVTGVIFHCQEDLSIEDGTEGGILSSRGNHTATRQEAFCGMKRQGKTPGAGAAFQAYYDPKNHLIHYDGLAQGRGAKVFQHIASRWIVLDKSDTRAVDRFVCNNGGWHVAEIYISKVKLRPQSDGPAMCVKVTSSGNGSASPSLGACSVD